MPRRHSLINGTCGKVPYVVVLEDKNCKPGNEDGIVVTALVIGYKIEQKKDYMKDEKCPGSAGTATRIDSPDNYDQRRDY